MDTGQFVPNPRVALMLGCDDEVTLQCEDLADLPLGEDLAPASPDIRHVRVRPGWLRYSDYRPDSFTVEEFELA